MSEKTEKQGAELETDDMYFIEVDMPFITDEELRYPRIGDGYFWEMEEATDEELKNA